MVEVNGRRRKSGIQDRETKTEPRFSRRAILGAAWLPFAFVFFGLFFVQVATSSPVEPAPWQTLKLLMVLVLALGLTAPFGTTILGLGRRFPDSAVRMENFMGCGWRCLTDYFFRCWHWMDLFVFFATS